MKNGIAGLVVVVALWSTAAGAQVVALPGTVVGIEDQTVAIEVCSYEPPRVHDLIEIGFKNNDGSRLDVGVWRVVGLSTCLVEVEPVCDATFRPGLAQPATVFVNTRGIDPPPEPDVPIVMPERATESYVGDRIDSYVEMLGSEDSRERQYAAKALYRHYRYEPRVHAAAEVALLEWYMRDPFDAHHVDAMSWLCNILGVSGNRAFRETLEIVMHRAESVKLSRYAARNLYRLG